MTDDPRQLPPGTPSRDLALGGIPKHCDHDDGPCRGVGWWWPPKDQPKHYGESQACCCPYCGVGLHCAHVTAWQAHNLARYREATGFADIIRADLRRLAKARELALAWRSYLRQAFLSSYPPKLRLALYRSPDTDTFLEVTLDG